MFLPSPRKKKSFNLGANTQISHIRFHIVFLHLGDIQPCECHHEEYIVTIDHVGSIAISFMAGMDLSDGRMVEIACDHLP